MRELHRLFHHPEKKANDDSFHKRDNTEKAGELTFILQLVHASGRGSRRGRKKYQVMDIREWSIT